MNLNLTGHHVEITPAIRDYVIAKLERINAALRPRDRRERRDDGGEARPEDRGQRAPARQGHPRARRIDGDMYAAIDGLVDKLDRQVLKHKEKLALHRHDGAGSSATSPRGVAKPPSRPRRRIIAPNASSSADRRCRRSTAVFRRPPRCDPPPDEPDRRTAAGRERPARPRRESKARCSSSRRAVRDHRGLRARVFDSLFEREKLGSTGLGQGVAIPHGRIKGLKEARGAFVRLAHPIPFDAPDGKPVAPGVRAAGARARDRAAPGAALGARADVQRAQRSATRLAARHPTHVAWRRDPRLDHRS